MQTKVSIPGDREQLRRLLLNLVDNAVKYTPPGGSVVISLGEDGRWGIMRVTDTGIGLSGDEQERVFRRFHRGTTVGPGDERGIGLGLSIARSIAEAHGGRITVESSPGRGSTFSVFLPRHESLP
jgi:signal transduction histidine kinase